MDNWWPLTSSKFCGSEPRNTSNNREQDNSYKLRISRTIDHDANRMLRNIPKQRECVSRVALASLGYMMMQFACHHISHIFVIKCISLAIDYILVLCYFEINRIFGYSISWVCNKLLSHYQYAAIAATFFLKLQREEKQEHANDSNPQYKVARWKAFIRAPSQEGWERSCS